jgi:outer membrane cobalamin receptor
VQLCTIKTANMKTFYTFIFILISNFIFSQTTISGRILDAKLKPISGANVFLDATYDGAITDSIGKFSFSTSENGIKKLIISFVSFETLKQEVNLDTYQFRDYKLQENANVLDAVIITAGTFDSGDKARVSVLKPLDIVTTAGSNANIISALQTLPGTNVVGEDGRLFVRGGEADETQTFVDGIRVAQPYGAQAGNVPSRGRFSPFLFSGISFSTGGYSAEYGEALSSILLLNTKEEFIEESTEISAMTVGAGLANTQILGRNSVSANVSYINLKPYQALIPQNFEFVKPFESLSGESIFRHQTHNGIFKLYAAFDTSSFVLDQESINTVAKTRVDLSNANFYSNVSYKAKLANNWNLFTGLGFGYGTNNISLNLDKVDNTEKATHLKFNLKKAFTKRFKLNFGGDFFNTNFTEDFVDANNMFTNGYNANITAVYAETEWFFSKKFAAKTGIRLSNNNYLQETNVSPRLSVAFKTGTFSQFAFAFGEFSQAPKQEYLKYANYLQSEKANHFILNYQFSRSKKTFRTEVYYKKYTDLVKFDTPNSQFNSIYNNNGFGYAKGVEVFWRDEKSIKNVDYWISYSFIDTKRDYQNFSKEATPSFVAKNTLSLVGKYWINFLKSQISITNTFASGRPFNNRNQSEFMSGRTKNFNNLSMSWAYLLSSQKILYLSVSNVLGTQNVFGYEYANSPDTNGSFARRTIAPVADRFIFLGFFWTISNNKTDNQLKNLN